jgi:hypothetical protein
MDLIMKDMKDCDKKCCKPSVTILDVIMGFALFIVVFVTVYIAFVEFTNIDINAF